MTTTRPLLLASASPRRRQLLSLLGLPFTVGVAPTDEDAAQAEYTGQNEELALWTAEHKAQAAQTLTEAADHLVITADTTVLLDGEILGKPRDPAHAFELLSAQRGRWQRVITGIAVSLQTPEEDTILRSTTCTTPVLMRSYSDEEIRAYIASGDPMDKAGAYGIQHPEFQPTERINGCYLNVVGLPLCKLVELLETFDIRPPREAARGSACPWSEKCLRTREVQ